MGTIYTDLIAALLIYGVPVMLLALGCQLLSRRSARKS